MKIAAVCCTYMRPRQLGHLVRCFERQDYPHCELVILDDTGQYDNCTGDRWRLVSVDQRFESLGAKRNAAAELVSPDVEALCQWDDDDWYLPWALKASVIALCEAEWSRPSVVLRHKDGALTQEYTWNRPDKRDKAYQGGWAIRRETFWEHGPYPADRSMDEDIHLCRQLVSAGVTEADPMDLVRPFYVWSPLPGRHLSGYPAGVCWKRWESFSRDVKKTQLIPADPPIDLQNVTIEPGINPRGFAGDWS